jgi:dTDP-4-dehydrorhamnose reductase
MHLLVIGGSGFLGQELARRATAAGHRVTATYHRRPVPIGNVTWSWLDIRRAAAVKTIADTIQPDAIINTAYHQGDWTTTADGGLHVALAAAAVGARFVHVSSDAVFSGKAVTYHETAVPDPITPYAGAKAAAETAVRGITPDAVIARTSLTIGDGGSRHEKFVHALATGNVTGALFTDEIRCPVHVTDLASALLELTFSSHSGVHHIAGPEAVSRHALGVLIARRDGLNEVLLPAGRRADSDLPGPLDVRLDSGYTQSRLATRLRGAREFL